MGRMLVLILVVVLVVWLIRRAFRSPASRDSAAAPLQGDLVACARCGVNLPRSEARALGSELYCSEEHARLGKP